MTTHTTAADTKFASLTALKRAAALLAVVVAIAAGCDWSPTEPTDGCRNERAFCDGLTVQPLSDGDVRLWERRANDYVTAQYGTGTQAWPSVTWHPCFFTVGSGGTCAAGWTESASMIHVSTAEPNRTGPLVAHETLHAIYAKRFGDIDADHSRPYGW